MGANSSIPVHNTPPPSGVFVDVRAARNYARGRKQLFTVYELHLQYNQFTWVVAKRFSEISAFHKACRRQLTDYDIPCPPKTWRRKASRAFVASRLEQLRRYFKVGTACRLRVGLCL